MATANTTSASSNRPAGTLDPAPRTYAQGVHLLMRRPITLDRSVTISHTDLEDWLLGPASRITTPIEFIDRFASQLAQCGLGVDRFMVSVGTLHPHAMGYSWAWNTQDGLCDEIQIEPEALTGNSYRKNPIFRVIEHGETIRVDLRSGAKGEGSLMEDLAKDGFTEYVALPLSSRGDVYNAVTLTTRIPEGFSADQWVTLRHLISIFALHVERHIVGRITQNIALTYLGREAGGRVVSGSIQRGSGVPIEAIVWSSDMRSFSALSETADNQDIADLLNTYFSVLADAVIYNGGDVLKFIGDGMLAVFPIAEFGAQNKAAEAAATAAGDAVHNLATLNADRAGTGGWKQLRTGIGLHHGDVFFGNIGAERRLDFTVIGEAVNIASRIEGYCKPLERDVLMSSSVAQLLPDGVEPLGSHPLKGMQRPEELFALTAPASNSRAHPG